MISGPGAHLAVIFRYFFRSVKPKPKALINNNAFTQARLFFPTACEVTQEAVLELFNSASRGLSGAFGGVAVLGQPGYFGVQRCAHTAGACVPLWRCVFFAGVGTCRGRNRFLAISQVDSKG